MAVEEEVCLITKTIDCKHIGQYNGDCFIEKRLNNNKPECLNIRAYYY